MSVMMAGVVEAAETSYAQAGEAQLAYRVGGAGPDVVCNLGTTGLVIWENDWTRGVLDGLTEFSRIVVFDPRGCGRSDPILPGQPRAVEDRVADQLAVMDAAGMEQPFVFAWHDGGAVGIMLAASHPDRVRALFLCNTWPRLLRAPDYPWGIERELSDRLIQAHRDQYGTGFLIDIFVPSKAGDPQARAEWAELEQRVASRAQAVLMSMQAQELDVRDALEAVRVPTVVAHTVGNRSIPIEAGRYIAERIPDARFVELPGIDQAPFTDPGTLLGEIREFVTGTRRGLEPNRVLATILFTDIVDSTTKAATLGDRRWSELLDRHDQATARTIARLGGRVIKTTGDGVLATFDAPTRAIRAAAELVHQGWTLGLELRAGLHTGEIEWRGDDVGGLAVNAAARIAAAAQGGEILVSSTVKDLSAGSGINFPSRGSHTLKGMQDPWLLYAVEES
jgi:class 3 adenylate cyclase/pimeloyl-ACP methyl ester carboxylesterase